MMHSIDRLKEAMPTYVYRCGECNETLEALQSFSDKPLRKHADCGGPLSKVFQAGSVVFKGGGYYVTDSRSPDTSTD